MKNSEFNKLFKSKYSPENFEVRITKSCEENIKELRRLAFLKHNCKFLYERLSDAYGDAYGEQVMLDVMNGTYTLSNEAKFTFDKYKYVEETLYLDSFFRKNAVANLFTILGDLSHFLLNYKDNTGTVFLPDLLLILSMYYTRFMQSKYSGFASFFKKSEQYRFVQNLLQNFVKSLSGTVADVESAFSIAILDKPTFKTLINNRNYKCRFKTLGKEVSMRPTYSDYVKFCKIFFKCYKRCCVSKTLLAPKLTYYIYPVEPINTKVFHALSKFLNTSMPMLMIDSKSVYYTLDTNVDDVKYCECLQKSLDRIHSDKTLEEVKDVIKGVIQKGLDIEEDKIDFTQLPMYKFLKKRKIKAGNVYMPYDILECDKVFFHSRSEVSIDYEKVQDELLTLDETMVKLGEMYNTAQSINQARLSIFVGVNSENCRCNVIIKNVPKELIPLVYLTLREQNKFITNTYGINFTFVIKNTQ